MTFLIRKNILKISTLSLALLSLQAFSSVEEIDQAKKDHVYSGIQKNLEEHLYQLPPRVQGHYGELQPRDCQHGL